MQSVNDFSAAHRTLLDQLESGVATFRVVSAGRDFVFADLSAAGERIARLRREEVVGRSVLTVFPGSRKIGFFDLLRRVWRSGAAEELSPVFYQDGRIEGWRKIRAYRQDTDTVVAIYDDVSALKTYERVLGEMLQGVSACTGEEFFRSLVRQLATVLGADVAVIAKRIEAAPGQMRTMAIFNEGQLQENFSYDLVGTPCAEALDNTATVRCWPVAVQKVFPGFPLLAELQMEGYVGAPLRASNGYALGIMAVLYRQAIPDPPMVEAVLQLFAARAGAEIERCQMEEALRCKEAKSREDYLRLLQMLEGVSEPICLLGADYRTVWSNQAHQKLFGALDNPGCCFSGFDRVEHCAACPLHTCLCSGQPQESLKTIDGKTLGIKMFPLGRVAGSADAVIAFSSDITEKMQQRKEAEQQERLIALGELAAGVAHEINNPNALVLLNAPVLREIWLAVTPLLDERATAGDFALGKLPYSRLREVAPKLFDQIQYSAERIRAIVEELKDFVSPGERVEATIDLGAVVRSAIEQVQAGLGDKGISLQVETLAPVRGSAPRLEQVFVNLLTNALQALDQPGRKVRVQIRHLAEEESNVVEVTDEGVGMAPEVLQRITDPFFTTRRHVGGLGLGLSVSARIIRDHGGRMQFISVLGRGTTARVVLPVWIGE